MPHITRTEHWVTTEWRTSETNALRNGMMAALPGIKNASNRLTRLLNRTPPGSSVPLHEVTSRAERTTTRSNGGTGPNLALRHLEMTFGLRVPTLSGYAVPEVTYKQLQSVVGYLKGLVREYQRAIDAGPSVNNATRPDAP